MTKRIISFILILLLIATIIPLAVAENVSSGGAGDFMLGEIEEDSIEISSTKIIYQKGELAEILGTYGTFRFGFEKAEVFHTIPGTEGGVYQLTWRAENIDCLPPNGIHFGLSSDNITVVDSYGNTLYSATFFIHNLSVGESCVDRFTFNVKDFNCRYLDITFNKYEISYRIEISEPENETEESASEAVVVESCNLLDGQQITVRNCSNETISDLKLVLICLDTNGAPFYYQNCWANENVNPGSTSLIWCSIDDKAKESFGAAYVDRISYHDEKGEEHTVFPLVTLYDGKSRKLSGDTLTPIESQSVTNTEEAISVVKYESDLSEAMYSYYHSYFTLKNMTEQTIQQISLDLIYLDVEGNIIYSTYPSNPSRLRPGQTISIEGLCEMELEPVYVYIDAVSYYEGNNYLHYYTDNPTMYPVEGK